MVIATIINSIVFGYVASNSKSNKTNRSYLIFLSFIILYTIFDCIIIQTDTLKESKDIIVKIQALFWMPLSVLFLNFTYSLIKKEKDEIFYLLVISTITSTFFTLFTDKVLLGYKDFNFGTMAYTGPWFLPITFIGILPSGIYAIYLIGKEGKVFNIFNKKDSADGRRLVSQQLKILFYGSSVCLLIAVTTNIFFDEVLGYSGELHLASLSLSIQSIFLLPALIKYNFLKQPIETLGDELYLNSSDAVFITNTSGTIINLNKMARKLFNLKGHVVEKNVMTLFVPEYNFFSKRNNIEIKTKTGYYVTVAQNNISSGKFNLGKILTIRDITPRIKTEEKLYKSEKELQQTTTELNLAQKVSCLGSFTYDVKNNKVTWSDTLYKIYGRDKKIYIPTRDNFINEIVHADSRKMVIKKVDDAINNKSTDLIYIHKTLLPNDQEKWFRAIIKINYNKKNEATIINGTSQDITELHRTRLDLEKSELYLKKAQEIAKLGTWEENHETQEIYWSSILKNMFGIKEKTKINKGDIWKKIHSEDIEWMKNNWQIAENKKTPYSGTFRIIMKNGETKHLTEHAEFIVNEKGNLYKTVGTVMDTTELYNYQVELRQLSFHIQTAQEKERAHIASEIHDELGQRLTSMTMDLAFLKSKIRKNTSTKIIERISALTTQAEETIKIIRKISQELRPSILDDLGLISAIDWLVEQYNKRTNIHFKMDMPTEELHINGEHATAIFRITQEALTNIIRHAKAKNVSVHMKLYSAEILLRIEDDGKGFKKQVEIINKQTFGVFGMKERATSLGGRLKIKSNYKKGTTVQLTLPYKQKHEYIT